MDENYEDYQEWSTVSNDLWNMSVDASIEGSSYDAYMLNTASIEAAGYADQAWDAWTPGVDSSAVDMTSYDATSSFDTTSSYETTGFEPIYDAMAYEPTTTFDTSFDTTSYDSTSYDTTSYDTGSEY